MYSQRMSAAWFAVALLVCIISPANADEACPAGAKDARCAKLSDCTSPITGFSTFTSRPEDAAAFVQDLRPLISSSREEPGNCGYHMYTDPTKPGVVGFVEQWADHGALKDHLAGKAVTSTFNHQYYKELRAAPPMLAGPWFEVSEKPGNEEIEMVFYWTMKCPKKHIWDIITNWTDASWVKGKPETTIVPLDDDGKPMSDEEAKKKGYVDPEGGLGPVVQRRTWPNGHYVDVRMLSKNEENFTTVQQTLSSLVFPKVVFDKFYVTLTLDSDGLDSDVESRMRYHTRATLKTGTFDDARNTLKSDFYGPRIDFYQEYFNCSGAVQLKRAENTIRNLHTALSKPNREEEIAPLFEEKSEVDKYLMDTFGDAEVDASATVEVKLPFDLFSTPDLRVVAVEDILVSSVQKTSVEPRIVIYQVNEWGRIVSTRIFDEPAPDLTLPARVLRLLNSGGRVAKKLVKDTEQYFKILESRVIEKVRALYSEDATLEDPVSFAPSRTFDSVYTNFYKLATAFEYKRYPSRTFVDVENRQTAQVIDATFKLASGDELKARPIQVFTFDKQGKITKFEAFFRPSKIDFSKLK